MQMLIKKFYYVTLKMSQWSSFDNSFNWGDISTRDRVDRKGFVPVSEVKTGII